MARNSEKAQSMLYRFREQQAAEMGMGNRRAGDRRPRIAASVSSLRDCERWRGDVLKEISRKVSKIQDVSLTDYEIRDLNDEINSLMREKRHWETQIVALGGANYKRAQSSMTDDAGREVPGTRGYKYFGRAKDLPGVKELFARGANNATEESARNASFQMFRNQGPEYFGDLDEVDADLLREEEEAARQAWAEAVAETANILSIPEADIPYPVASSSTIQTGSADGALTIGAGGGKGKRKANGGAEAGDEVGANGTGEAAAAVETNGAADDEMAGEDDASKKARTENGPSAAAAPTAPASQVPQSFVHSFGGLFDPASLGAPALPTQEQLGEILLEVRKRALREEYGV